MKRDNCLKNGGRYAHVALWLSVAAMLNFLQPNVALADAWQAPKPIHQGDWLKEAERCETTGQELEAILAYTNAVECGPATSQLYYRRALLYYKLGYCALAKNDASHAILLNSSYGEAYYLRANIEEFPVSQSELRDEEAALCDYSRAIELLPELGPAYYARARILARQLRDAEALKDYERVLELGTYGYQHGAHVGRGILYGRAGHYKEAMQELKQADPVMNPWETTFALAQVYERCAEWDLADAAYRSCAESDGLRWLTAPQQEKLNARLVGDWQSAKEWR